MKKRCGQFRYKLIGSSEHLIRCEKCGGVGGDPFIGFENLDGKIVLEHYSGAQVKAVQTAVLDYSKTLQVWYLLSVSCVYYNIGENTKDSVYRDSSDFGVVELDSLRDSYCF
jgi:hypothetical protein